MHIAVRIDFLAQLGGNGRAILVANTLRNCDHAASELVVNPLHIFGEFGFVKRTFRQIHEVRTIVRIDPSERSGCGEKTCMASHDDIDLHPGERTVVQIIAHESLGHETRAAAEARRVIVLLEIVVDRLGNVEAL